MVVVVVVVVFVVVVVVVVVVFVVVFVMVMYGMLFSMCNVLFFERLNVCLYCCCSTPKMLLSYELQMLYIHNMMHIYSAEMTK